MHNLLVEIEVFGPMDVLMDGSSSSSSGTQDRGGCHCGGRHSGLDGGRVVVVVVDVVVVVVDGTRRLHLLLSRWERR